jgi:hypothetical protein
LVDFTPQQHQLFCLGLVTEITQRSQLPKAYHKAFSIADVHTTLAKQEQAHGTSKLDHLSGGNLSIRIIY